MALRQTPVPTAERRNRALRAKNATSLQPTELAPERERLLAARATLCRVVDWLRDSERGKGGPAPDSDEAADALDVLLEYFPPRGYRDG